MYFYIKALHIIFVITWFSGLFYIVRLFIYNTEANDKPEPEKTILQNQFNIMIRRLWFGITWPSAVLSFIFGPWMWYLMGGENFTSAWNFLINSPWLIIKVCFAYGLLAYHISLHVLYSQQSKGIFKYSSNKLRIWNEVATVFLFAIVMLAAVKQGMGLVWGLLGLAVLIIVLMSAIKIYKSVRKA